MNHCKLRVIVGSCRSVLLCLVDLGNWHPTKIFHQQRGDTYSRGLPQCWWRQGDLKSGQSPVASDQGSKGLVDPCLKQRGDWDMIS